MRKQLLYLAFAGTLILFGFKSAFYETDETDNLITDETHALETLIDGYNGKVKSCKALIYLSPVVQNKQVIQPGIPAFGSIKYYSIDGLLIKEESLDSKEQISGYSKVERPDTLTRRVMEYSKKGEHILTAETKKLKEKTYSSETIISPTTTTKTVFILNERFRKKGDVSKTFQNGTLLSKTVTAYIYDSNGDLTNNIIAATDATGNESKIDMEVTIFAKDKNGNPLKMLMSGKENGKEVNVYSTFSYEYY